jgi:hypothetical protein
MKNIIKVISWVVILVALPFVVAWAIAVDIWHGVRGK